MTDKERLENMSPIGFDLNGNILLKSEDYHWLMEQAERVEELELEINDWIEEVKKWEKFYEETKELLKSVVNIAKNIQAFLKESEKNESDDVNKQKGRQRKDKKDAIDAWGAVIRRNVSDVCRSAKGMGGNKMTDKERLEEIRAEVEQMAYISPLNFEKTRINKESALWLIQQAERVQELEEKVKQYEKALAGFNKEFNFEYRWQKSNVKRNPKSQWQRGALEGFEHVKRIYDKHVEVTEK